MSYHQPDPNQARKRGSQGSPFRLYGILLIAAGGVIALVALRGFADSAGNIHPLHLAGLLIGAALALIGAMLGLKPTADTRPALRYLAETLIGGLDAAGEWAAQPRAALALMIPVLLLATFLRVYHLTFQSLWLDELMTWWRSSYNDLPTVLRSVESDVWPPGYSLWIYAIIHTLGASDYLLRFPAALGGVLSVAAIYLLGRRLGGHLAGLFAALLLAVLEISIYYSQEARPYSGLILFSILSTYFGLRLVEDSGKPGPFAGARTWHCHVPTEEKAGRLPVPRLWIDIGGYVVTALLAAYWNYYGIVLIACQALGAGIMLIRKPRSWPALIGVYVAIGVGYLPWARQLLDDFGRDVYLAVRPGGYGDELMAFLRALLNLEQGYVLAAIGVVVIALIAEGIRRAGPHPPTPSPFMERGWRAERAGGEAVVWLILVGWLLLPFTITYVRSLISVSTFLHRYLLISLPAAALLIGLALSRLPIRRWMQAGLMLLAVIVLLNNLVRHWDYYTRVTKAQFRETVEEVEARDPTLGGPSVIVAYTGYHGTLDVFDFYFEQAGSPRRTQLEAGFGGETPAVEELVAQQKARYVWLIAAQNLPDAGFLQAMGQTFSLVEHRDLNQAGVWLYVVK